MVGTGGRPSSERLIYALGRTLVRLVAAEDEFDRPIEAPPRAIASPAMRLE